MVARGLVFLLAALALPISTASGPIIYFGQGPLSGQTSADPSLIFAAIYTQPGYTNCVNTQPCDFQTNVVRATQVRVVMIGQGAISFFLDGGDGSMSLTPIYSFSNLAAADTALFPLAHSVTGPLHLMVPYTRGAADTIILLYVEGPHDTTPPNPLG